MPNKDIISTTKNAESIVAEFHRAGSLIPKDQKLIAIKKDTKVSEALQIMKEDNYSQLPVMAGQTVLGIFSYRSFALEAARRQRSQRNTVLSDLPVEEFMEDFPYIAANEDWTKIQRQLDEKDGFFVGHSEAIDGLVTTMDVYHYFRNIADPFIHIAEIEIPLRRIIADRIPPDKRAEVFGQVLRGSYAEGDIPKHPKELSLNDEVLIVTSAEHWHFFKDVLGAGEGGKNTAAKKFKDIPNLRNDVLHFKRELERHELNKLIDCRHWLHRCIRAYEGELKSKDQSSEANNADVKNAKPQKTRRKTAKKNDMNRQRLEAESTPVAAAFFNWVVNDTESSRPAFTLGWHKESFSIRWKVPGGGSVGIIFCHPSKNKFDVYLGDLKQSPMVLAELRQSLGEFNVLTETGKHTFQAHVDENNVDQLKQVYYFALDELERYG